MLAQQSSPQLTPQVQTQAVQQSPQFQEDALSRPGQSEQESSVHTPCLVQNCSVSGGGANPQPVQPKDVIEDSKYSFQDQSKSSGGGNQSLVKDQPVLREFLAPQQQTPIKQQYKESVQLISKHGSLEMSKNQMLPCRLDAPGDNSVCQQHSKQNSENYCYIPQPSAGGIRGHPANLSDNSDNLQFLMQNNIDNDTENSDPQQIDEESVNHSYQSQQVNAKGQYFASSSHLYNQDTSTDFNSSSKINSSLQNQPLTPIEIPTQQKFEDCNQQPVDISKDQVIQLLIQYAKEGDLMIRTEQFKERLVKEHGPSNCINFDRLFKQFLNKNDGNQFFHFTIRKFGDSEPFYYISLQLSQLSFQSLCWILNSMKKDEITPNEKQILNRIKECYATKINQQSWNGVMLYIKSLSDINGDIIFDNKLLPNLKLIKVRDHTTNTEFFNIYFKDDKDWKTSDQGPIRKSARPHTRTHTRAHIHTHARTHTRTLTRTSTHTRTHAHTRVHTHTRNSPFISAPVRTLSRAVSNTHLLRRPPANVTVDADFSLWKIFIEFLQEFFKETEPAPNSQSKAQYKSKWTSSVENINTKQIKKSVVRPPKSITKAIPGGRYGCAQLLKCCGPYPLRSCSLGKLFLFIQEAISKGILVYYKTLLIKPNNFNFEEYLSSGLKENQSDTQIKTDKLNQEQIDKILRIKKIIIEILQDNRSGVSLARLPKLIQRRISFQFDLHELGNCSAR